MTSDIPSPPLPLPTQTHIYMGEGWPPLTFYLLLRSARLPKNVKAEKRVFVYDNCCNFHKHVLRRYPWQSRKWHFVIDRHHYKNHKMCSRAYDMDSYKWLDKVNSQVCEQRNNSLRKMAKSLAHMKFINDILAFLSGVASNLFGPF